MDKDKRRAYFQTHPEQRKKRSGYCKKWVSKNRDYWNAYMRDYRKRKKEKKDDE
jgi:hypothetical protein